MLTATDLQLTDLDLKIISRVVRHMARESRWADTANWRRERAAHDSTARFNLLLGAFWDDNRGAARSAEIADLARMCTMARMSRCDVLPAETVKSLESI